MQAGRGQMQLRVAVDFTFDEGNERVARRSIELRAVPRRHQARAKFADDLFPGLGIRGHGIERVSLEVQATGQIDCVVAIETILGNSGRLLFHFVAGSAATGGQRASQRNSSE
jgi:hypothetical protein